MLYYSKRGLFGQPFHQQLIQGWFESQFLAEQFTQGWLFVFCHLLFLFCFHVLIIAKWDLLVNQRLLPAQLTQLLHSQDSQTSVAYLQHGWSMLETVWFL